MNNPAAKDEWVTTRTGALQQCYIVLPHCHLMDAFAQRVPNVKYNVIFNVTRNCKAVVRLQTFKQTKSYICLTTVSTLYWNSLKAALKTFKEWSFSLIFCPALVLRKKTACQLMFLLIFPVNSSLKADSWAQGVVLPFTTGWRTFTCFVISLKAFMFSPLSAAGWLVCLLAGSSWQLLAFVGKMRNEPRKNPLSFIAYPEKGANSGLFRPFFLYYMIGFYTTSVAVSQWITHASWCDN